MLRNSWYSILLAWISRNKRKIKTYLFIYDLPIKKKSDGVYKIEEKNGCHDDNGIISWFVYINDLSLADEWKCI
jgi:hypothetical protein